MRRSPLSIALAAWLATAPAQAQDAKEAARELATRGIELYHQGDAETAYERIREAEALFPAVTHRVYLARCLTAMGRLVEAKALYAAIVAEARPADLPEVAVEAYATAATELEAVSQRVPRVRLSIAGAKPESVTIDGRAIAPDRLGEPIEIDPGAHRVVAQAAGGPAQVKELVAAEGEVSEVAFTFEPSRAPIPPELPGEEPRDPEGSLVPAYAVFGVGAAALVVGGVTGGISLAKVADIKEGCRDEHCLRDDADEGALASRLGTTSTVSFVVAGAAVAAGVVLVIVRPGGDASNVSLTPLIGPGFVGLRGAF